MKTALFTDQTGSINHNVRVNMKKLLWMILPLMLSGCSSGTTSISTAVGGVETNSSDIGRYTAWAAVETKKAEVIQAIETAQAPAPREIITVNLSTPEAIREWAQLQTTVALKDAVTEMARALRPRNKTLDAMPMPKGAFAEGVDSTTGLIGAVMNSPVGVAGAVGYFVGSAAKSAGTKVTATDGSEVTVNQVSAKGTSTATVDQSSSEFTESFTDMSDHSVGAVTTTGAVDSSTTDTSNNSTTDNSTGPVDTSNNSTTDTSNNSATDNSVGPVDNSNNSTGPVDNSVQIPVSVPVVTP